MNSNLYQQPNWSNARKFFFYLFVCYFILYSFPFPLDVLVSMVQRLFAWIAEIKIFHFLISVNDFIDKIFGAWNDIWKWLVPAIGKNILHLKNPIENFTNGSGDTLYDYVMMLVKFVFALLASSIWYFRSKKKTNHTKLYYILVALIRYYLAYMMLSYGFAKVIQSQFPSPSLIRYLQPYGESSPMGLAWTFMGQSTAYNVFTGGCEVLGGLLLLFRRTKTFGALFTMTVCMTIFVMNMCFDIPVKLFSFHLFIMATYIAADDFTRLIKFFFTNKQIEPYEIPRFNIPIKWAKKASYFKYILILFLVYTNIKDTMKGYNEYGMGVPKPPLYGIYTVESKSVNNNNVPLLYKDTNNWKQIIIPIKDFARIKLLNDSGRRYAFEVNDTTKTILYHLAKDTVNKYNFKYTYENEILTLQGKVNSDSVKYILKHYDENNFLLKNRGFHWINGTPFNR